MEKRGLEIIYSIILLFSVSFPKMQYFGTMTLLNVCNLSFLKLFKVETVSRLLQGLLISLFPSVCVCVTIIINF